MKIKAYRPPKKSARLRSNQKFYYILIVAALAIFFVFPKGSKAPDSNLPSATVAASPLPTNSQITLEDQNWPSGQTISAKILMYHHVGSLPEDADDIRKGLTVSAENFELQVKYLKDGQYNIATLEELYKMVARGEDTSRVVVLSFDDGYSDNFDQAWPIMDRYGVTGTFFIISNKVGQTEYMSEQQIKDLSEAGNEIASHSVSHPSMEKLSAARAQSELIDSKKYLEELTGRKIVSFCYPAGKYSDETKKLVGKSGYKIAVTTQKGKSFSTDNPFEIPRYRINPGTNLKSLM